MKFTREERSWITYDWANSSYATIVLAAIFPIYFASVCSASGSDGDFWWSVGAAVSTAVAALISPFLGAMADYRGIKKQLMTAFLALGVVCTIACAWLDNWQGMLIGYGFSYVGFSISCMLYDSFLVDVSTRERMPQVSAWGFSMGYLGGSTIPFLACIALISFGESYGIDAVGASKLSMVITAVWWAVFSIPFLRNCHQRYGKDVVKPQAVSLKSVMKTLGEMVQTPGLRFFMLSYFFYIDGVNTIIKMSTAYGATLGLGTTGMILALLVLQIVAVPCVIVFGRLSNRFGAINLLCWSMGMYFVICVTAFIMGFGIEEGFLTIAQATTIFWVLSIMVGTVQGGIQSVSRSYFGKIIPPERASEFFGVFDIFGKFAAVMGPALYAVVKGLTGRSSLAILVIIVLFFVGLGLMLMGRPYFEKD